MAEKILVQAGEGQPLSELARGLLDAVGDGDPHDVEYSPHVGGFLVPEAVAARYSLTVAGDAVVLTEPGTAAAAEAPAAGRQRSRKPKAPRAAPKAAAAPAEGKEKAPRKRASRSKAAKAAAAAAADGDGASDA